MSEKLLPCPFCGCEAKHQHNDYRGDYRCSEHEIYCSKTECQMYWCGDDGQNLESVAKEWNTRTLPQEVQDVIEAAKTKLIFQAARLLSNAQRSEFEEDHPRTMPKSELADIEKQNECLRQIAVYLRVIAYSLNMDKEAQNATID